MTLFIGPVGDSGGPAIKNSITIRELQKNARVEVLNTLNRARVHAASIVARALISADKQVIVAVSSGGRRILFPILRIKGLLTRGFSYSIICIGGTIPEEAASRPLYRKVLKDASVVAVETSGVCQSLRDLGMDNVVVMPNMVENTGDVNTMRRFEERPTRFVYLSSIRNGKGIKTMLEAFRKLQQLTRNEAILDIYGPIRPDFDLSLFDDIDANSAPIRYLGAVPHSEVSNTMRNYHCLLFPSEFETEGFPGIIAEAMSIGLPIIASNVAHNSELIEHGRNGLLFETGNAESMARTMLYLLNDPLKMDGISRNNRIDSQKYRSDCVVGEYASNLRKKGWGI